MWKDRTSKRTWQDNFYVTLHNIYQMGHDIRLDILADIRFSSRHVTLYVTLYELTWGYTWHEMRWDDFWAVLFGCLSHVRESLFLWFYSSKLYCATLASPLRHLTGQGKSKFQLRGLKFQNPSIRIWGVICQRKVGDIYLSEIQQFCQSQEGSPWVRDKWAYRSQMRVWDNNLISWRISN